MNKLSNIQGPLSVVANPLAPAHRNVNDRSAYRYKTTPWRAWYTSKRWAKLRKEILNRDMYTCTEPECGILLVHKTNLLIAHHKKAHKGIPELFWDKDNITTVCKQCHDGIIQKRERQEQHRG